MGNSKIFPPLARHLLLFRRRIIVVRRGPNKRRPGVQLGGTLGRNIVNCFLCRNFYCHGCGNPCEAMISVVTFAIRAPDFAGRRVIAAFEVSVAVMWQL